MKVKAAWQLRKDPSPRGRRTFDRFKFFELGFEYEHTCWDPKDGELCLNRVKSRETSMEARSDTDVQIVRRI